MILIWQQIITKFYDVIQPRADYLKIEEYLFWLLLINLKFYVKKRKNKHSGMFKKLLFDIAEKALSKNVLDGNFDILACKIDS
jgi:hypothetical protein